MTVNWQILIEDRKKIQVKKKNFYRKDLKTKFKNHMMVQWKILGHKFKSNKTEIFDNNYF